MNSEAVFEIDIWIAVIFQLQNIDFYQNQTKVLRNGVIKLGSSVSGPSDSKRCFLLHKLSGVINF